MNTLQHSSTDSAPQQPPPDPQSAADFYGLFHVIAKPSGHSEEFKVSNLLHRCEARLMPYADQSDPTETYRL